MEVIKNRIYKHFKGDYYLVVDIAIHSETKEELEYTEVYMEMELYMQDPSRCLHQKLIK